MLSKIRKRYTGLTADKPRSHKLFHLVQTDFPGLSFAPATAGKLRLDQNDGTNVPLAQIPDILAGKDADSVDGYNLDQSVEKASKPEFKNIRLTDLTGIGQLLYSQTNGELTQNPGLFWDVTNQHLDININKTGYGNLVLDLRNIAGGISEVGGISFRLGAGDFTAQFEVYHGDASGKGVGQFGAHDENSKIALYAGAYNEYLYGNAGTNGYQRRTFGSYHAVAMYTFNSTNYWEENGNILVVRKSNDTYPFVLTGDGKIGLNTTPTALLDINSDILRLRLSKTPSGPLAPGNAGDICWDADYIYICVATNNWKRAAISTWS